MLSKLLEKNKKTRSAYNPSEVIIDLTKEVQKKADHCHELRNKPFREFNDMSLVRRAELDQKTWNVYEERLSNDPDEAWRWNGRRSTTRNKVISTAAHVISSLMIPNVVAQDEYDEEDIYAAIAMRDMILWNIDHSEYEMSQLFGTISACVNPCAYIGVETALAFQEIRKAYQDGHIQKEKVMDEVFSGMQIEPEPLDEIWVPNFYQHSHQKQPYRFKHRLIDYDEAHARYGMHPDFALIQPGRNSVFSKRDGQFYDVQDEQRKGLVEELIYMERRADLEIPFLGGIYMGHADPERNRIKHRNNKDLPFYPEAKFGYEPIDEKRFYYYKSLVFKLWPEQRKIDKMERLAVDGTIIKAFPPIAFIGAGRVDSSIIYPGSSHSLGRDAKINPIETGMDLNAVYKQIDESERAMSDSSQDSIRQGQSGAASRTAFEISRVEQNAIIKEFAIFGRMVASMVEQVGAFMINDIIRHQTVLEAEDITNGLFRLKDRSFLLEGQTQDGKKVSKKLLFTDEYMGTFLTETEKKTLSYAMFEEEERNGRTRLAKINPHKFAQLAYSINIEPDAMIPQTWAFKEDRSLRSYSLMMQDPFSDKEAVSRDFLYDPLTNGNSDKYMKKAAELGIDTPPGEGGFAPPGGGGEADAEGGDFVPQDTSPSGRIRSSLAA